MRILFMERESDPNVLEHQGQSSLPVHSYLV